MSWSMVMFGGRWAHAHDAQQEAFMRLAAMYATANPRYRATPWFHDWSRRWQAEAGNQGNGVSDVLLREYLTDGGRIEVFREFLRDYQGWVAEVGPVLDDFRVDADKAAAFARLVTAVVLGDDEHPQVHRATEG